MEKLDQFLHSINPLSSGLRDHLFSILRSRQLKRGDHLLLTGETCRNIYYAEKGLLRSYYWKGETEVSSSFMLEGDLIISPESFYKQQPGHECIQALEDCLLYYISHHELTHIFECYPEFNFTARVLTERYHTFTLQQLFGLRLLQAHERYHWLLCNHPHLIIRVPAKYLASWLGLSEVMLSRIKNKRSFLKIS